MTDKETLITAVVTFGIGTVLFLMALYKQFRVITDSRNADPLLKSKLFFFLFNLFNVLTTLTLVCGVIWSDYQLLLPSAAFYFVSAFIAVWTYYSKKTIL